MKSNGSSQIISTFWNLFNERQWDEAGKLLSDDFSAIWPQSREKIVGSQNYIEINRRYPGTHKIEVLNIHQQHDQWDHSDTVISEVYIQSQMPDGKEMKLFAVSIFVIEDEKIKSATEYWGDCYPAPEWRKDLVENY